MHVWVTAIGVLRAPILTSILAVCFLSLPAQTSEIFRSFRELEWFDLVLEYVRASIAILTFTLVIVACCRKLIVTAAPGRLQAVKEKMDWLEALSLSLMPLLLVGLIIANIDAPLLAKIPGTGTIMIDIFLENYFSWWRVFAIGGVLVFGWSIVSLRSRSGLRSRLFGIVDQLNGRIDIVAVRHGLLLGACCVIGASFAIAAFPSASARIVGPIGAVFLFLSVLTIMASMLCFVYDKYGIPLLTILVIAAFVWAFVPTNDNHSIRLVSKVAPAAPEVVPSFLRWLESRPDRKDYANTGRAYPVYIVTAEGGGHYAAAHAAWTLARIQDNCPAFARHIFAISSVSGGSLGAALFSALMKANPPNKSLDSSVKCPIGEMKDGPLQVKVKRFLDSDFLTPVLLAGLFPDFLQRFIFWPIGMFDRSRALDRGIETAWLKVNPTGSEDTKSIFRRDVRQLWSAEEDAPALLLNSTLVHSGERLVIAPFQLRERNHLVFFSDRDIDKLNHNFSPRLSTAISISARFPIVTPPALSWDKRPLQMVDGGFYDNAGVMTAINLVELLRRAEALPIKPGAVSSSDCAPANTFRTALSSSDHVEWCLKIISIRARGVQVEQRTGGDALSAVQALYNSRIARGRSSIYLTSTLYCGGALCGFGSRATNPHVYTHLLNTSALSLPLGWLLSKKSLSDIMGNSGDCRKSPPSESASERALREENACLYEKIARDLN